jgi:hypothetical protein
MPRPHYLWSLCTTLAIFAILPAATYASAPVGFVDGIWLDTTKIHAGEQVRIYVAVRNSASTAVSATLKMHAGGRTLPAKPIRALPGRLIESWVDWTPNAPGTTTLSATLTDVVLDQPNDHTLATVRNSTLDERVVVVHAPHQDNTSNGTSTSTTPTTPTSLDAILPETITPSWYSDILDEIKRTEQDLSRTGAQLRPQTQKHSVEPPSDTGTHTAPRSGTTTGGHLLTDLMVTSAHRAWDYASWYAVRALAWLFGHPTLVQLAFLLGLLWLSYRTARYYGRP